MTFSELVSILTEIDKGVDYTRIGINSLMNRYDFIINQYEKVIIKYREASCCEKHKAEATASALALEKITSLLMETKEKLITLNNEYLTIVDNHRSAPANESGDHK